MTHELRKEMGADLVKALRAHRQLERTLRRLEQQMEPILRELAQELVVHFEEEEGPGGYYETLRARFPHLSDRLERLRGEHGELLESVRAAGPFVRTIVRTIRRHEQAENELLQLANGDAAGGVSD